MTPAPADASRAAAQESSPLLAGPWLAAFYAVLGVLVLLPVFSVSVPCLGDYLNHLARIHILTSVGHSPALRRFYQDRWQIVPYFGMDVPVAALIPWFGIYGAGRIFVATCVLMPVAAAATLRYALHRRVGLMPAVAFLFSYNFVLALGFLNYLLSACLAVMLFAGWIAAAGWPRWLRALTFVLPALVLYFSHVFAFVAYGILVIGYELGRAARAPRKSLVAVGADFATAGVQAVLPALLAVLLRAATTFGTVQMTKYGSLSDRIGALVSPLYFPGASPGVVTALVVAPLACWALAGRIRLSGAVWPALMAAALAAAAAPAMLLNIWGTAFRLPIVCAMVLIGAVIVPPHLGRGRAGMILGIVATCVCVRVWTATVLMRQLDAQVTQMRQVVAHLPEGARLLVVDGPDNAPRRLASLAVIQHMALVAAIDRDAFVPNLFTGTTPLQMLPEMAKATSQAMNPLTLAQMREGYATPAPPGPLPLYRDGAQKYWLGWPTKFDDVLLTHFGGDVGMLPPNLYVLARNDIATLYRIEGK